MTNSKTALLFLYELGKNGSLYSLISLENFKTVLGIDDRDDKISRFCLVTSTLSIEHYCKRKILRKKYSERINFYGDLFVLLNEFPVSNILAVYVLETRDLGPGTGNILEPEFYHLLPVGGTDIDIPFSIELSPAVVRMGCKAIKVIYWGGYSHNKVPSDLAAACLELASWNFNRYKGKRIGMTGNIKGSGKEGEHFETVMPENVRSLLEPYRRKVI
jgi:hypothetical protein